MREVQTFLEVLGKLKMNAGKCGQRNLTLLGSHEHIWNVFVFTEQWQMQKDL